MFTHSCMHTHTHIHTHTHTLTRQAAAEQFYSTYNGRKYNTLEKTVCQLVYVSRVEIMKSSQGGSLPSPGLMELPSCPVCLERLVRKCGMGSSMWPY